MSSIQAWTLPPPFSASQATQIGHSGPKSSLHQYMGFTVSLYVKVGPKETHQYNEGRIVKSHGQICYYCILNGVKDVKCHKI